MAGLLTGVAGLVAVAVPAVATVGTAAFIGAVLIFASVALALDAFSRDNLGSKLMRLLLAGVTLAAGLYLMLSPLHGTFTLTVILVLWFVALWVSRIVAGLGALGSPGAGFTIANGVVSLVLAYLIGRKLPSSADWAIGLLVGIDFLFAAAGLLWLAWRLPKAEAPA